MSELTLLSGQDLASRRKFIRAGATLTLSAFAVALLAGNPALAAEPSGGTSDDVELLATALVLEHQAIAAYQIGAESNLLEKAVLDVALAFQNDHKQHAELVSNTIVKLGGKPVKMRKVTEYGVPVDKLKSQTDVLKFAASLEHGAAIAYMSAIPVFTDRELTKAAASTSAPRRRTGRSCARSSASRRCRRRSTADGAPKRKWAAERPPI